ncbi:MAG: hypothetical protein AB7E79_06555 [Rhodospirillaceae bacterium]
MANKSGTRPPLHRDAHESDRPVPKRTWRHARYGDAPEAPPNDAPQDKTFSEEDDAAASGDVRPHKP